MPTLQQLQVRIDASDTNLPDALAAAKKLSNYLLAYNEEYNALIKKRQDVEFALIDAKNDSKGVDHGLVLHLESLKLGIESRMKVQDAKLLAFHASKLSITPPTSEQVKEVKALTAKVATLQAKDRATNALMDALGSLAGLVNQFQ